MRGARQLLVDESPKVRLCHSGAGGGLLRCADESELLLLSSEVLLGELLDSLSEP